MSEKVKIICITCPKGCTLDVTRDGATILNVDGAGCKRGAEYVEAETRDPRRMVATTVRIQGSLHPLLPVYTAKPFPKPRIKDLLSKIREIELKAPVNMGDVVLKDALGTGVDIIASRDMIERKSRNPENQSTAS
jgi:CxxC motif-containing protein